MLTLGQQLLAKKKKERERIAIPSGFPAIDTNYFVKLVSLDDHVFVLHKDCAAVSKVLKPLIYPHLTAPGDNTVELGISENDVFRVEGHCDVAPPLVVFPEPPKRLANAIENDDRRRRDEEEDEANRPPPPPPPGAVVHPNLLAAGADTAEMAELQDDDEDIGATAIRIKIPGALLEIVVQYLHYKQRYEHSADRRPPFNIHPSVALKLLEVATKLQC